MNEVIINTGNYFNQESILYMMFAIPLIAAFVAIFIKSENLRDVSIIILGISLFTNVISLAPLIKENSFPTLLIAEITPALKISFTLEWLGFLFALVASFLWIITTIYSIGYMRTNKEKNLGRFYCFFALSIFSVMGIALSDNLLTLFLCYELLTIFTFPLVAHEGDENSKKGAKTYLSILIGTSMSFFLIAVIWVFNITGTLDFKSGGILAGHASIFETGLLLLLFSYGIGKAALMPFHRWLPAAMVAPTPVSALLHAVAVVKAGVFSIVKIIVYIFGIENLHNVIDTNWWGGGWLVVISGTTILCASVIALRQDNLKKRLAFSTVSQLSYVIMAVALLAPQAVMAAGFHIAAHAIGKITLFFAAGSIYTASGKKYVSELNGIGKRMPYTMAAFAIASLSMIGLPPTVGFLSKYYMLKGAFEYGNFFAVTVIVVSTLLNAAYFLPIIYAAFFKDEDKPAKGKKKDHGEAPLAIVISLSITALLVLILFVKPDLFIWLASETSYSGS